MLKILAFLFIFLYLIPFLTGICCFFPKFRYVCFFGMLYFTSNERALHILPDPEWTGTARGFAFNTVSLFALPLLLSMIFSFRYKVRFFPPGVFFYFLYFLANLISGVNATAMIPWGFEINKMVWMYITFITAFSFLNNNKDLTFFFYIVCFILSVLFIVGFDQKYRWGIYQIPSTFPHQNSLSLYLELYGLLTLGILMNERISRWLFLFSVFSFSGSVLLIVFTYSRGGLVVYFGGIAIVCALSILFNGFSLRRLLLMLVGLAVLLCVVGYALPRIILRFTKAPEASKNTRIELAYAARMMANEHRLGVGANNYNVFSAAYRDRLRDGTNGRGGIVETIYLLVAAECGWWGLYALLSWFLYYYISIIISMFILRKMPCSGISIGIFAGLTCNYWHSSLEWSLKQPNNFAGQMIIYALVGVLAVNRKNIRTAYRHRLEREALEERSKKKKKRRRFVPQMPLPPDFPEALAPETPEILGFAASPESLALSAPEASETPMPDAPETAETLVPDAPKAAGTPETNPTDEAAVPTPVEPETPAIEANIPEPSEIPVAPEPSAPPTDSSAEPSAPPADSSGEQPAPPPGPSAEQLAPPPAQSVADHNQPG